MNRASCFGESSASPAAPHRGAADRHLDDPDRDRDSPSPDPKPSLLLDDELAHLVDRLAVAQTRNPSTREAHRHCADHPICTVVGQGSRTGTGRTRRVASNPCADASCRPRRPTRSPPTSRPPRCPSRRSSRTGTWRRPSDVYVVVAGRRRAARHHPALGARPVLGQGGQGRQPDDQRPGRDAWPTSGAFKRAFAKRRCLIPADGFYEWQRVPGRKNKQPYFIHRPDGEPFAFAGLWEVWRPKDEESADEEAPSPCARRPSSPPRANEEMARIHDRMPVILPPVGLGRVARPGERRPRDPRQAAGPRAAGADDPPAGEHRGEQRPQPGPAPRPTRLPRPAPTPCRRCSTAPSHGRPARRDAPTRPR